MATTVEVLGAFTLVFTVFNAVLGVLLLHLSYLKAKNRALITWIYNHAGFESLNAVRNHLAKGNVPISHSDTIDIIEDATTVGDADWSKEPSLYTENEVTNQENLGRVLDERRRRATEAVEAKKVSETLRRRNVVEQAMLSCTRDASGQIYCPT